MILIAGLVIAILLGGVTWRVQARFRAMDETAVRLSRELQAAHNIQKETVSRLQEKEFHLQAILHSMREGVMVVDDKHIIRLVNPQLLEFFNLQRSPLRQTVLESLREAPVELLIRETMEQQEIRSIEFTRLRNLENGPPRLFQITAVPIKNEGVQATGVVAIFYDVTRLRHIEEARRELIANVSHELRTPLSIFRGYLETVLDEAYPCPPEIRRILQIMSRHSDRLNILVDDLLTLARLELRRIELEPVSLRLEPFLRQVHADWQSKLTEKNLAVHLSAPSDLPLLDADPFRLEQVITNLLENAIKYSNPGGRIEIAARASQDRMTIEVRDFGVGIPASDLPYIFDRFYRVDKARSREQGGTGLGLSIVWQIVLLHGGSVTASSEFGSGTTITLELPLVSPGRKNDETTESTELT